VLFYSDDIMKNKNFNGLILFTILFAVIAMTSIISASSITVNGQNNNLDGNFYIPFSTDEAGIYLGESPNGPGQTPETKTFYAGDDVTGYLVVPVKFNVQTSDTIVKEDGFIEMTFYDMDFPEEQNSNFYRKELVGIVVANDGPASPENIGNWQLSDEVLKRAISYLNYEQYQEGTQTSDVNNKVITYKVPFSDLKQEDGLTLQEFVDDVNSDKEFVVVFIFRSDFHAFNDITLTNTPESMSNVKVTFKTTSNANYDCEVYDTRVNQIIYHANNNELMWNVWDGGFVEKHILCYGNEWYEGGPTHDWGIYNGNFIPAQNVVAVGTKIGDWTMSGPDGIWIKDDGGNDDSCKLIRSVTLDANNEDEVVQENSIRGQGWQSYPNNPVKLSQTSINQLVNPISLDEGEYKVVISDGAWSQWDNDIGNSAPYGGAPGLAWTNWANVVYDDNDLTISKFGITNFCSTKQEAENAGKGEEETFEHDGGNIYLFLDDSPIDDNRGSVTLDLYDCTDTDDDDDDDSDDDGRDNFQRFGYGGMCEENWVFADWSSCEDGLLTQTRKGVDTNQCDIVNSEVLEVRACEMQGQNENVIVKPVKKPFPLWILILLITIIVLIFLIIIKMMVR